MIKTLKDFNFENKRVLIRVDFNVPLDNHGHVKDDSRIRKTLPTIQYLLDKKAKIILMSHLGRPDGKVVEEMRLDSVAVALSNLLELDGQVAKLNDCINVTIPSAKLVLLENLRFYPEEEKNDREFAKKLASLADIYINDAFAVSHRAHASVAAITEFLPSGMGLLFEQEVKMLSLDNPKKPFTAIMGGSKISTKIGVIENMLKKVDYLLLGGAMIFTFYKAQGHNIGKSLVENDKVDLAKKLLGNRKIILPIDIVIADRIDANAQTRIVPADKIPDGWIGLDLGPETVKNFEGILKKSKTIIWNGPLGYYEIDKFAESGEKIALFMTTLKATTVVGGGDTGAIIDKLKIENKLTFVSTAGGASLEYLEGKKLPGIKALEDNAKNFK